MPSALIERGIPAFFAILGASLLALWVRGYMRAPQLPDRPLDSPPVHVESHAGENPVTRPAGTAPTAPPSFASLPATSTNPPVTPAASVPVPALPGLWPEFRGPARDGTAESSADLAGDWAAAPPRIHWSVNLGEGYAGPAVRQGRVYLLDYDQGAQADTLRCFALADGREVWRQAYPVVVKRNHGMSRTVPAVTDRFVVTLGPKCHVLCADAITGRVLWFKDLVREFGATVPEWYAGQCPLIDGDRVILAPGGQALMIAVELSSGKVLWKAPNPRGWTMTHSSITPITFKGERMFVYCGSGGVAAVSAKDGAILWDTTEWTINTATVPSPVAAGDGKIFLTGGYGAGSLMLQMEAAGGKFSARSLFRLDSRVFGSEQHTPILYRGSLYGIASGGQLICLDLQGNRKWASGSEHRFGLGPFLIGGGRIYAMDESGILSLIDASPSAFKLLGQVKALEGPEAWAPMALVGTRLLARDLTHLVCLEVGRK